MGSTDTSPVAPRATPLQVAESFVSVYYRVCADLPSRLPQLYGSDSQLDHGLCTASGEDEIAHCANNIALAGKSVARIVKLTAQRIASGGYVVMVLGWYEKDNGERKAFSQTFVLERQIDSHEDHFYCRNDCWVEIEDGGIGGGKVFDIAKGFVGGERKKEVEELVSDTELHDLDINSDNHRDVNPDIEDIKVTTDDHLTKEEDLVIVPNGIQEEDAKETTEDVPSDLEDTTETMVDVHNATPAPLVPDQNIVVPNGIVEPVEERVVRPLAKSSPVKKTWASIVSNKEDLVADNIKVDDPVVVMETMSDQLENIPPAEEGKPVVVPPNLPHTNPHAQSTRPSAHQNGHRSNHITARGGHQRIFGPSAIVHLSSLNPDQLQDPRALCSELRTEFAQYGFRLRHVEVKAQKGIAFVEYDTSEGVRAAVDMWANGPRVEGAFAGVPLIVTEKRPYNKWRANGMRVGGRGGTRGGGRRNRPPSTPLS